MDENVREIESEQKQTIGNQNPEREKKSQGISCHTKFRQENCGIAVQGGSIRKIEVPRDRQDNTSKSMVALDDHISVQYSEVDPSRVMIENIWCISLVRKAKGAHKEHAFLIIEGVDVNLKRKIWFCDLVGPGMATILPGMKDAKIRMEEFNSEQYREDDKLLFCCNRPMMDVRATDRILYQSWSPQKSVAERLLTNITLSQTSPPRFNILGEQSLGAIATGQSSSISPGHSCFTWAKKMLRDLNDPHVVLPADDLSTWLVSATSRFLKDPEVESSALPNVCYIGGGVLVGVAAVLLVQRLSNSYM